MPEKVLSYARPTVRRIKANLSWIHTYLPVAAKPHSLPGLLIVSLTSYPPRFPTVYKTLVRLLHQSVKADRTILWIAPQDIGLLPEKVRALQSKGLEIRPAPETGPYKKIIPALQAFPDAFIVTADDDLDYDVHWLRDLLRDWDGRKNQVVFHRGHEIRMNDSGMPGPYAEWAFCIPGPREHGEIFPTGAGGVLYPPHVLHDDVLREADFSRLAPHADDIWLFWMGRRAGATYKKTARKQEIIERQGTQDAALWRENLTNGANDKHIARMIAEYGWPSRYAARACLPG